jgi:hypothetical protein
MRYATLIIALICVPQLALAQNSSDDFENLPVPSWAAPVLDSFDKPVHPLIGSVASGGGIGFGLGYSSRVDKHWYRNAEAMVSIRRYWSLEGEVGRRSLTQRSQLGVFAGVRHMNRLDYFGIGPDTIFDNRSAFRLRETAIGTRGWFRPVRAVRLGGSLTAYKPDLGPGANPSVPSIEDRFLASVVPGFSAEPMFGRYRGFAELVYPAAPAVVRNQESPDSYRGAYQFAVEAVRDHDSGRHDFHRWETEVQQRIPGLRPGQRLTLHGFVASTNSGSDVPFYMLYTLGGSSGLKSFRPGLFGTDGTQATLRSFKNFRFRDRNLVLMQAEYRIPIISKVDATVFIDAGQVGPRTSDLFKNLRTGTGFSLSYMQNGRPLGRIDVGFGGGEGVQLFWSFSALQN